MGRRSPTVVVLSCEHGGNQVPVPFRHLFHGQRSILETHRGWDIGALAVATRLRDRLGVELFYSKTSRLLVDLNRSLHHPKVFSTFTFGLDEKVRQKLIAQYYAPYRTKVEQAIRKELKGQRRVVHLSIHSFTPVMNHEVRTADIGLLYDPQRGPERSLARGLQTQLKAADSPLRVRLNYPYRGIADGFQTALRREFSPSKYLALEIEFNQAIVQERRGIIRASMALGDAVQSWIEESTG